MYFLDIKQMDICIAIHPHVFVSTAQYIPIFSKVFWVNPVYPVPLIYRAKLISTGGFQLVMGVPLDSWMVFVVENPFFKWMIWWYPPFQETSSVVFDICLSVCTCVCRFERLHSFPQYFQQQSSMLMIFPCDQCNVIIVYLLLFICLRKKENAGKQPM